MRTPRCHQKPNFPLCDDREKMIKEEAYDTEPKSILSFFLRKEKGIFFESEKSNFLLHFLKNSGAGGGARTRTDAKSKGF